MSIFKNDFSTYLLFYLAGMLASQSLQGGDLSAILIHQLQSGFESEGLQRDNLPTQAKPFPGSSEQERISKNLNKRKLLNSLQIPDGGGIQIVARIGLHQQPTVIRLQIFENHHVRGAYFYLKHKKILALNGKLDGEVFELTESYDGKVTGHLKINLLHSKSSKWFNPSKSSSERISIHYKETLSEEAYTKPVQVKNYDRDHPIEIFDGKVWERLDVTDDVDVLLLDDGTKMFLNMHVVTTNGHMGAFTDILESKGREGYVYRSPDCEIISSLTVDELLEIDENCRECCGARATLSGSFPLKRIETFQLCLSCK